MASMGRYGMEVCEMRKQQGASATTSDAVDGSLPEAPVAAPSIEVSTPEVLITEEEVVSAPPPLWRRSVNGPAADRGLGTA
jgi:hypothetical protein